MSNALRIVHKNHPAPQGRREHPARFRDLRRSGGEPNLSPRAGSVIRRCCGAYGLRFHLSVQTHKTSYYCKEYKDQRNIKSLSWPSFCYAVGVIAARGSLRGNGEGIFTCCQSTALCLLFLLKPFSLGGVASAAFSVFRARCPPGPEVWHFLRNFKDSLSLQLSTEAVLLSAQSPCSLTQIDRNRRVCHGERWGFSINKTRHGCFIVHVRLHLRWRVNLVVWVILLWW